MPRIFSLARRAFGATKNGQFRGSGPVAHLKRFLIERDIPGVGGMSAVELCGAARSSNRAIEKIGTLHWQYSYVAGDKTFCIYLADSTDAILKHAEMSGLPVTRITEVPQIIDPLTANN
jgi:hypothetical protein